MGASDKKAKAAAKPRQLGFLETIFEGALEPKHVGVDRNGKPAWVKKKVGISYHLASPHDLPPNLHL